MPEKKVKAVILLSGGLDSTLAMRLAQEQGVEVHPINIHHGFCNCNAGGKMDCKDANKVSKKTGAPLKIMNVAQEFLDVVKHPKHGYGAHMNPCIDCRIFMLKKAKKYMEEIGADFVITGEVLGQRPKSQYKAALKAIEKEAGLEGKVVRPLTAKNLEETEPEKLGLIQRDNLLDFKGRNRKPQMALAKELEITEYPAPAGGCLLADAGFSRRLKDLMKYKPDFTVKDAEKLKRGRHFRIGEIKIIVGRNQKENRFLNLLRDGDTLFEAEDTVGPITLLEGKLTEEAIQLAARITARYSDAKNQEKVKVRYENKGEKNYVEVKPMEDEVLNQYRL